MDVVSDGTCESVFKCSFVQAGNTICGSEKPTHIEGIGKEVNRGDAVWTEDSSCQIDVNEGTHSIHNRSARGYIPKIRKQPNSTRNGYAYFRVVKYTEHKCGILFWGSDLDS